MFSTQGTPSQHRFAPRFDDDDGINPDCNPRVVKITSARPISIEEAQERLLDFINYEKEKDYNSNQRRRLDRLYHVYDGVRSPDAAFQSSSPSARYAGHELKPQSENVSSNISEPNVQEQLVSEKQSKAERKKAKKEKKEAKKAKKSAKKAKKEEKKAKKAKKESEKEERHDE
jgi:hypothetical protein